VIKDHKKYEIELGTGDILHKVIYFSPDCEPHSHESWVYINGLLNSIISQQSLLTIKGMPFQKMEVKHNGMCWEVEVKLLEAKDPEVIF
jgi:hypothetical protein